MDNLIITVGVVTYNSAKYILDALDSVYNQTYSKIELVIADDCSKDNTVSICKKWIDGHKDRFLNVIVVESNQNSGVAINCNHACKAASGDWIKLIAGDDILPQDAIANYVREIMLKNYNDILCAKCASFVYKNSKMEITDIKPDPYTQYVFKMDSIGQYSHMLYEYVILFTIGCIISKQLYEKVGYYDESFPEIEDHPFMLKLGRRGIRINYTDGFVGYLHRTEIESASQTRNGLMNKRAFCIGGMLHRQDRKFVLPYIPKWNLLFYYHYYIDLLRRFVVIHILRNSNNFINRNVNRMFLLLDPIFLKKKIYNYLHRSDRYEC